MSFAIFSSVGLMLVLKFLHVGFGTLWLGATYAPSTSSSPSRQKFIFVMATATLISGLLHIAGNYQLSFYSSWGLSMLTGSGLGILMWLNLLIDRDKFNFTNFAFAWPMLFFMEAASHLGMEVNATSEKWPVIAALAAPVILVEIYSLIGKGPQIRRLDQSSGVGLILLVLQYLALELLTK